MSATARTPLLRYLLEGVVIVGSILLAFGIDAWWDERGDREIEHNLLIELQAEFEGNREALRRTAEVYRMVLGATEELIEVASSDDRPPADSLSSLFGWVTVPPHWEAANGALATAVNSGRIALIRNPELRRQLVGWDGVTSDLYVDEASRIDVVWRVLAPTFAEFGIAGEIDPQFGRAAGLDPATDFDAALRSRRVRALLRRQVVSVTHLLGHYETVESSIDGLIDSLDAELLRR